MSVIWPARQIFCTSILYLQILGRCSDCNQVQFPFKTSYESMRSSREYKSTCTNVFLYQTAKISSIFFFIIKNSMVHFEMLIFLLNKKNCKERDNRSAFPNRKQSHIGIVIRCQKTYKLYESQLSFSFGFTAHLMCANLMNFSVCR